uniref:Uncharacterized protein n=1 Tax=Arundo donax TaxID=35708 RepID=A0A0A9H0C1_ARUDO
MVKLHEEDNYTEHGMDCTMQPKHQLAVYIQ